MSAKTPNTVVLRGVDELEYKERPANAEIRPGMLVERANDGVQPHATTDAFAKPMFAVERRYTGMLADDPDGLSDTYSAGELTLFVNGDDGYQFYALLAAGEAVSDGTHLVSAGDGTLQAADYDGTAPDTAPGSVVGQAIEAVDNAGGADPVRVRVEI